MGIFGQIMRQVSALEITHGLAPKRVRMSADNLRGLLSSGIGYPSRICGCDIVLDNNCEGGPIVELVNDAGAME